MDWNNLLLTGSKKTLKWPKPFLISMFIANNYILDRLCHSFVSKVSSTGGVLPGDEFKKKFETQFTKDLYKYKLDGQTLTKCDFLKVDYLNLFLKDVDPVVRKPYIKFQQLILSKTAILEHP